MGQGALKRFGYLTMTLKGIHHGTVPKNFTYPDCCNKRNSSRSRNCLYLLWLPTRKGNRTNPQRRK